MKNNFFNFIDPFLSMVDNGKLFRKPFSWLYSIIAIINLLFPFYFLYKAIDNHIFRAPAKSVLVFLIVWITILFACWIGFQIWWNRKDKVNGSSSLGDEFIATPVFSHFIQTLGEWLGTWVGLVGFVFALLTTIILGGREGYYLSKQLGLRFLGTGLFSIILLPIWGFMIIVISRFLAEQIRALATIANNTKKRIDDI